MSSENNANFTPDIDDIHVAPSVPSYTPTGYFKFWAQKVLPAVYDDSLSYYEVLTRLTKKINEVIDSMNEFTESAGSSIEAVNELEDYINSTKNSLINAYNELQGYVNHYFDNLDIQTEINAKLDLMAANGTLSALIAPIVGTIADTMIPTAVSTWLENNITPTTPPLDSSLTVADAAAESKAVGDRFAEISVSIDENTNTLKDLECDYELTWTQGKLDVISGTASSAENCCYSDFLPNTRIRIKSHSSYYLLAYCYDRTSNEYLGVLTGDNVSKTITNDSYFHEYISTASDNSSYKIRLLATKDRFYSSTCTWIQGPLALINGETDTEYLSKGCHTDFMERSGYVGGRINVDSAYYTAIVFFDVDNEYLTYEGAISGSYDFTIPNGCTSYKVSIQNADLTSDLFVADLTDETAILTLQINQTSHNITPTNCTDNVSSFILFDTTLDENYKIPNSKTVGDLFDEILDSISALDLRVTALEGGNT